MSNRKYSVICGDDCLHEGMTKEQILTAISQAANDGEIKDVDTGFVSVLKEQNKNAGFKVWVGTTAEFNALTKKQKNCLYIKTDDTIGDDLNKNIENIKNDIKSINEKTNLFGALLYNGLLENNSKNVTIENISKYKVIMIETPTGIVTASIDGYNRFCYDGVTVIEGGSFAQLMITLGLSGAGSDVLSSIEIDVVSDVDTSQFECIRKIYGLF